ncbi:MAG: TolC family protein [Myxococcales bacterium]|nr:TolC family protein [Myxococcales bacterium]MCB9553355.1 TolC family protein [Myxococcales bacterium]
MRPAALFAAAALAACNPLHTAQRPEDVDLGDRLPAGWQQPPGAVEAPDRWWAAFGDAGLETALDRLLAENLDLVQAWARLQQARAIAEQQGAPLWPQVNAQGTAGASRVYTPSIALGPTGPTTTIEPSVVQSYGLSLAASYELDLWDRLGATARAAELDARASRLDYEALAISLTAQAADLWFALVEQRATEALLQSQIETNETLLGLMRFRFAEGLAAAADVLQQEQLLLTTRRQLPAVQARRATLEHQLALLLGRPPAQGVALAGASDALPAPPPIPAAGLPSALLDRRPDLRAARLRVTAADERVGAALAARLPSLTLSASTGFQADSFGDLIDRWVWSLAGQIIAPLVDGGRRRAEVERTRAVLAGALAAFVQTSLRAFGEVEDALVLAARQAETIERLEAELEVGRALLEQARARYTEGLTDYLPVLTALQGVQRAEIGLLAARRLRLSYHIQLYRALGGRWTDDLAPARLDVGAAAAREGDPT